MEISPGVDMSLGDPYKIFLIKFMCNKLFVLLHNKKHFRKLDYYRNVDETSNTLYKEKKVKIMNEHCRNVEITLKTGLK